MTTKEWFEKLATLEQFCALGPYLAQAFAKEHPISACSDYATTAGGRTFAEYARHLRPPRRYAGNGFFSSI